MTTQWRVTIRLSVVAFVLLAAAGCSSDDVWTEGDRAFVAAMIPHHHLGMVLVDEATLRSHDVRLRRLVFEMSGYHTSELDMLERWSESRHIPPAAAFPGRVPDDEVRRLADLATVEHDVWWLDLMIRHHRGAVEIADSELRDGAVPAVRAMAGTVRRVQAAEIEQMENLRHALCSQMSPTEALLGCR